MKTKTAKAKKPTDTKPKPPVRKKQKTATKPEPAPQVPNVNQELACSAISGLRKVCFTIFMAQMNARFGRLEKIEIDYQTVDYILGIFASLEQDMIKSNNLEHLFATPEEFANLNT